MTALSQAVCSLLIALLLFFSRVTITAIFSLLHLLMTTSNTMQNTSMLEPFGCDCCLANINQEIVVN